MRKIISIPFSIVGSLIFKVAELIRGEKITYRAEEVLKILEVKAECTKCGHKGTAFHRETTS